MGNALDTERVKMLGSPLLGRTAADTVPKAHALIVSDVRLYRDGLALGLERRGDVHVAGTAETFDAACALIETSAPTVVLLDAGMPYALDFARQLLRVMPSVRIVAVAVADEGADVVACAEAGLSGYVLRDGSIDDVATAIHDAMFDELHCSSRVSATLFKRLSMVALGTEATLSPLLTPREAQVVALVDRGLSNKQIAERLRIGTATVKNHVHNILEKLHVGRRAEAAALMRAQRSARSPMSPRRAASITPNDPTIWAVFPG